MTTRFFVALTVITAAPAWADTTPQVLPFSQDWTDTTQLNTVNDNSVDDAYYLSWSGSYDFRRTEGNAVQLFWVINNLLDEEPAIAPGGNAYPTNPVFFDTLGLRYRAGVRFEF